VLELRVGGAGVQDADLDGLSDRQSAAALVERLERLRFSEGFR